LRRRRAAVLGCRGLRVELARTTAAAGGAVSAAGEDMFTGAFCLYHRKDYSTNNRGKK